jgi:hypothetical protein
MSTATSTVPRVDEHSNEPATSPTGRWAFMDRYVELWIQSLHYEDAPSSTVADPRFDTFLVPLPSAATRKLLYATELRRVHAAAGSRDLVVRQEEGFSKVGGVRPDKVRSDRARSHDDVCAPPDTKRQRQPSGQFP